MNFFDNKWSKSGTDINEFWNTIHILDEKTGCIKTNVNSLSFYSIQSKKDDNFICYHLNPFNQFERFKSNNGLILGLKQKILNLPAWLKTNYDRNFYLIKDTYLDFSNKILVSIDESEPLFIDMDMIRTLGKMLGYSGPSINEACLERDLLLSKLCENDVDINIIYIEDKGIKRLVKTLSKHYYYEPQEVIKDIYDEVIKNSKDTNYEYEWNISHQLVSLMIKKENSYIKISNSNKGNATFAVEGYINKEKIFEQKSYHDKNFSTKDFTDNIQNYVKKLNNEILIKQPL